MLRIVPAATALSLLVPLTSCTGALEEVTGPDPQPVAEQLADGLGSGELSEVPITEGGDPTEQYTGIVDGLGEVTPAVAVDGVVESEDGATATATLGWSWPLTGQDWTYTSEATLRLVDDAWRVAWEPEVVEPSLRSGGTLELSTVRAQRGDVLGAGGRSIVTERPVTRFGIDKSGVRPRQSAASARELAVLLDLDAAAYAERVQQAGDEAFVEALVLRREEIPVAVGSGYRAIPSALAVRDRIPLAPTREFAAPILGSVGEPTAEMIEEDPGRYAVGQQVGLSGLQLRYDEQLVGSPGVVVDRVASDGGEKELFREQAEPGQPLRLTLDVGRQRAAERLLADVGPASSLVAVRPSTGAVLAAANGPGTDGYNSATFGQYPPGSTFKPVSSLALLRAGADPGTPVPCTDSVVVNGKRFENYDDYPPGGLGNIPLRTALANSCNTAFIAERGRLGRGDLADAAASLGMGVDHDLGFPAYFGDVVPAKGETEAAANLIGQGKVLASPMVMATVLASIQAGRTVVPSLVRDVEVAGADVPQLTAGEARTLRELLRGVVTGGSGSLLADVPGPPVIAKTGTAEYVAAGGNLRTHAWMVAAQGDLAVAVFVETGSSGSGTAGPILESFLRSR